MSEGKLFPEMYEGEPLYRRMHHPECDWRNASGGQKPPCNCADLDATPTPQAGPPREHSKTPNKDAIRKVVEAILAQQYNGPGASQRGWMVCDILIGFSELFPNPQRRWLRELAASLSEYAESELEEQWPK